MSVLWNLSFGHKHTAKPPKPVACQSQRPKCQWEWCTCNWNSFFWEGKHEICEECDHFEHPRNTQMKNYHFSGKGTAWFQFYRERNSTWNQRWNWVDHGGALTEWKVACIGEKWWKKCTDKWYFCKQLEKKRRVFLHFVGNLGKAAKKTVGAPPLTAQVVRFWQSETHTTFRSIQPKVHGLQHPIMSLPKLAKKH